jgi:hypothetical protein
VKGNVRPDKEVRRDKTLRRRQPGEAFTKGRPQAGNAGTSQNAASHSATADHASGRMDSPRCSFGTPSLHFVQRLGSGRLRQRRWQPASKAWYPALPYSSTVTLTGPLYPPTPHHSSTAERATVPAGAASGGGIGRAGGSTRRQQCCLHLLCPPSIQLSVSPRYPGVLSSLTATPATAMAVPTVEQAMAADSRAYPLPAGFRPAYGTAGFRAVADLLHSTMFRCEGGSARSHLGMRGGGPTTRRPHPGPSPGTSPAAGAAS